MELKRDYPGDYEFLGFFEKDPSVSDDSIPWYHNTLAYSTERGEYRVECTISPSYGDMELKLFLKDHVVTALSVSFIQKIQFELTENKEMMIVDFPDGSNLHPLILQLKPAVSLSWGTQLE